MDRGDLVLWDVAIEDQGDVIEGTFVNERTGGTYRIQSRVPILLEPGRRAVDDFAGLLTGIASEVGFAEAIRRLGEGNVPFPIVDEVSVPVSAADIREAQFREGENFWETFSRNRLIQQQLNAIDHHWDAIEEMWMLADVNLADAILDVGTGWGGTFQPLLEHGPQDAFIVGLDTAFLNLKVAQGRAMRTGFGHAEFVVGDIASPPFQADLFDSVVSWFGVGSAPRFRECLAGVHEVLRPGGTFAVAWTPFIVDMDGLAAPDDLRRLGQVLDIPDTPEDAAVAADDAGFADIDVVNAGPINILHGSVPVDYSD